MGNSRTKLSMSIASFPKLRENDLLYVDKTRFIKKLEDLGIRHALLMRPRRFGKSLFLSTLTALISIMPFAETSSVPLLIFITITKSKRFARSCPATLPIPHH